MVVRARFIAHTISVVVHKLMAGLLQTANLVRPTVPVVHLMRETIDASLYSTALCLEEWLWFNQSRPCNALFSSVSAHSLVHGAVLAAMIVEQVLMVTYLMT